MAVEPVVDAGSSASPNLNPDRAILGSIDWRLRMRLVGSGTDRFGEEGPALSRSRGLEVVSSAVDAMVSRAAGEDGRRLNMTFNG